MKKFIIALAGLFLYTSIYSQTSANTLQDSLLARYNRNDFDGFYSLGSANWKSKNKPGDTNGWLGYMKEQTGNISRSFLNADSGRTQFFVWDGDKKMLCFKLMLAPGGGFDGFDFTTYHFPAATVSSAVIPNDNPLKNGLDSAVQYITVDFMLTHHLVGLSIGVVCKENQSIYNYGTVEKDKAILPTAETTFELASVTKTFTGILLAQAVLDKKLRLEDDIRKYMPGDFPNLQYLGRPLKIINLANHTSGLPAELPNLDTFKSAFAVMEMYNHYTDSQFFTDLRTVRIDTIPGAVYGYSNAGMKLLGIILGKVYGLSYAQLLKKYITGPMKMPGTRMANEISDTTSYTKGYDAGGQTMPHINFNMFGGAGAIISDSRDMVNYVKENASERLAAVKLAHQQTFENDDGALGMGWQIAKNTINGTRIWKSGGALGFRTYCAVVPAKGTGMIWLSNRSDLTEDELSEMADAILNAAEKKYLQK